MWAAIVNGILGVWLMAAPHVLEYRGAPKNNDQIVGPLIATFAIVAIAEVTRGCRWVNVPLGLWMVAAPFVLGFERTDATVNSVLVGLAVAALSFINGRTPTRYGGGWSSLWRSDESTIGGESDGAATADPARR